MSRRATLARFCTALAVLALAASTSIFVSPIASADTITSTPTSGTVDVAGSTGFSQQLSPTTDTSDGSTITYSQDVGGQSPDLTITGGGLVSVVGGPLPVGSYEITGSTAAGPGDAGSWTYSLSVTADTITSTPTSGTIGVAGSTSFSQQLTQTDADGSTVSYVQGGTGQSPDLTITGGGLVSVVGGPLAVGSYAISGTSSDGLGNSGNWGYSLSVTADTIVQGTPTSGSTNTASSAAFSSTLSAASGFTGSVAFSTSTPGFAISSGDELKTTGPLTSAGSPYLVTGSDSDAYGDGGTWTYTLSVAASGGGGGGGGPVSINQTSATTGSVSTTASSTYTAGPITVEGNDGVVTFVTTHASPSLSVSSSGLISTAGTLSVGTYGVSGTDSDPVGDSGTWTFTLTVTAAAAVVTVTFVANGGAGTMAPETESASTALSLNAFTRHGYTFIDWNTSANGSGISYSNGAMFPFTTTTELFAQWKRGKTPTRTITFFANGGTGRTNSEIENTPTAIKSNHFTRSGYTFVDWNTKAKGTGKSYKAGATYPFKRSMTLYAQWKKVPKAPPKAPPSYIVTFAANGGAGTMSAETHHAAATLTPNHFTRTGYRFVGWNTSFKGTGVSYANGSTYPFKRSITLYAQWRKIKVATPPPTTTTTTIPGGVTIGPFSLDSSTLSSALKSQIQSLAIEVKTNKASQITLYGFGDKTVPPNETNVELGQQRAAAVATYLEAQLTAIGQKGWTISIASVSPNQSEYSSVIAALS
jgi:uncharacterized repeat protein (TIGR02543 family)